jgi:inner membrane protease subunit 1
MMPTIHEFGDLTVVERLCTTALGARLLRPLARGDIVIALPPYRTDAHTVCKRVVALEGDAVAVPGRPAPVVIPPGHVWLEGDNAHNSSDSREYGPVPGGLIRGRLVARVWPPHAARLFRAGDPIPTGNTLFRDVMAADPVVVGWAKAAAAAARREAAAAGAASAAEARAEQLGALVAAELAVVERAEAKAAAAAAAAAGAEGVVGGRGWLGGGGR